MIKTPCKRICKVNNGICIGCKRTLSEIKDWSKMTDLEREKVIIEINNKR
jgi:predicted Fe-S protein YdhL (DUF1289 family)